MKLMLDWKYIPENLFSRLAPQMGVSTLRGGAGWEGKVVLHLHPHVTRAQTSLRCQ